MASPEFSWTPSCPVGQVEVLTSDGNNIRWLIVTLDDNEVLPPLQYGAHPDGMQVLTPAAVLESGTNYVIRLGHLVNATQNSQLFVILGHASFAVP